MKRLIDMFLLGIMSFGISDEVERSPRDKALGSLRLALWLLTITVVCGGLMALVIAIVDGVR